MRLGACKHWDGEGNGAQGQPTLTLLISVAIRSMPAAEQRSFYDVLVKRNARCRGRLRSGS